MPRVSWDRVIIILLILLAALLSVSQTILYLWNTPPGTVYPLVHNFVEDYYIYLDIMRQGWDGWWVATSRMTPEIYPRMVVSIFLLTLGHIARLLDISLPIAYTGARIFGGLALMVLVYQLIRKTFPQSIIKRIVAFCFVLFGTYFWGWGSNGPIVASLPHAWTELDPIFRWSFVPHHLWSKVGMLAVFLLIINGESPGQFRKFVSLLTIVGLVAAMGFTNPVVYVTFIPTLLIYTVLTLRNKSKPGFEIIMVIILVVTAGFVMLYHRYLQMNIFPWTSYLLWEQTLDYKVNPVEYAVSFGPTLVLFLLAIPTIWRLGRVGSLLLAWAASSWIMLYIIGPFVPVTPERFLGGYQFIPLGIGTAVWIFSLKRSHLLRLGDVTAFKATPLAVYPERSRRTRGGLMKFVLISVLLLYFSVGLIASFREHAGYVAENRNNIQVYIPKELMDAFSYLSQNSQPEDVVMAPYEISTMTPSFTGRRVVAGHVMFTKDVGAKRAAINEFFTTRDPVVANRILSAHNVRWILAPSAWIPPQRSGVVKRLSNKDFQAYSLQ
ncbi:MAG: hypothetical protein Q8L37_02885 [Candidatus Gottesmanbacteria bacterium]|nr:hypothetical protein [Candidatus Gottesmanbacteria bacterium]